ncbi:MAG TPA: glutamine-hydrolyzing carbamoyl-phosphate synthase small subunit [Verrucomicrobiae bacterium]|nr:glutamine-hydrolyzing carbamoyl-phosphate synthase small subunit [Verrucomicrobiae bacterium]
MSLSDGTQFAGTMPAWQTGPYVGEVVFNTGMTGYVESLTDPSYAGQILVFTYPLIGNYGVQLDSAESHKIQVSGVIVSEAVLDYSHSDAELALPAWLASQNIPLLTEVDTRALTKHLRISGTMGGAIGTKTTKPGAIKLTSHFVSIDKPVVYQANKKKCVILVDCGAKENILRSMLALPVQVKRVPHDYDYTGEDYDGVLLSNGPGDPIDYQATITHVRHALGKGKPVFGICLGSQIMGLAAGAQTYKLKFGHRGHNQPCLETGTEHGYITSQNHGYAVDERTLPKDWIVSFRNLNDNSVEGIEHKAKPFFSVQFHPEACPGPTDTSWLFERFYKTL